MNYLISARKERKSKIDQDKDIKILDSTRIYNSGRISGATDKGIANKDHYLGTPWARGES
jgi:hypothetical protein